MKKSEEIIIYDNRYVNILKGFILFIILFILIWIMEYCYRIQFLLPILFILTGIFYALKWAWIFLHRGFCNCPLFIFYHSKLHILSDFKKNIFIPYSQIKEIKLYIKHKNIDILIYTPYSNHPSGIMHYRITSTFQQKQLLSITYIINACKIHNIKYITYGE